MFFVLIEVDRVGVDGVIEAFVPNGDFVWADSNDRAWDIRLKELEMIQNDWYTRHIDYEAY